MDQVYDMYEVRISFDIVFDKLSCIIFLYLALVTK